MNPMLEWPGLGIDLAKMDVNDAASVLSEDYSSHMHAEQLDAALLDPRIVLEDNPNYPDGLAGQTSHLRHLIWEPSNCPGCTAIIGSAAPRKETSSAIAADRARQTNRRWISAYFDVSQQGTGSLLLVQSPTGGAPATRHLSSTKSDPEEFPEAPPWKFINNGAYFEFENDEYYKRQRISDRVNRDVVVEYLQALGFDLRDPAFWTSRRPAFLLKYHRLPDYLQKLYARYGRYGGGIA